MTDTYTPTTAELREAWLNAEYEERDSTTSDDDLRAEFDRWLSTHDAEVRASVLAEQGQPEWEYACSGKDRHGGGVSRFTDSPDEAKRLANRGYTIRRRTKAARPGPWLPVEENGENDG